jgi:malate dehydrogenase (oxaloacetate-decarboxylating)
MATGRSDFPNQINNSLVFPGVFRSIIDFKIKNVTIEMEIAAAEGISKSVKGALSETNIVPLALDQDVVITVVESIGRLVATSKL